MDVVIRDLGQQEYEITWQQMQQFTDARDADTQDEIWLVVHPPVFTQGRAGKEEHILSSDALVVTEEQAGKRYRRIR